MKVTYCDVCMMACNEFITAEALDGEHPHNGSTIHKDIDICIGCLKRLDLKLNMDITKMREGKCYKNS